MQITHLDHLVLTVSDVQQTCDFYTRILGFEVHSFGVGRTALHFGNQKINLHQLEPKIAPRAGKPVPGSADLCFVSAQPIEAVVVHLEKVGQPLELGPVPRTGAKGGMMSVYLRDPDHNLIEIASYLTD